MTASTGRGRDLEYLTYGRSRTELAGALWEYRRFILANPGSDAAAMLDRVARNMHAGIRSRLRTQRATGHGALLKEAP